MSSPQPCTLVLVDTSGSCSFFAAEFLDFINYTLPYLIGIPTNKADCVSPNYSIAVSQASNYQDNITMLHSENKEQLSTILKEFAQSSMSFMGGSGDIKFIVSQCQSIGLQQGLLIEKVIYLTDGYDRAPLQKDYAEIIKNTPNFSLTIYTPSEIEPSAEYKNQWFACESMLGAKVTQEKLLLNQNLLMPDTAGSVEHFKV